MKIIKEKLGLILVVITCLLLIVSCEDVKNEVVDTKEIYAWCIVPFDLLERTPKDRVHMLTELGISEYAYDWREKNVSEFATEWKLAQESDINIRAVWLWIDDKRDTVGQLHETNEALFRSLKEENLNTEIWVGFHSNFFHSINDENKIHKAVDFISYLYDRADSIGCTINLYNHGDWFGNPLNQIKIIDAIENSDIGLIYNFHHAYNQVQLIPTIVHQMLPYLRSVNVSGIVEGNDKITDFGDGDHELDMLQTFIDAGYQGSFGIIGHREDKDVKQVLAKNLSHFFKAKKKLAH